MSISPYAERIHDQVNYERTSRSLQELQLDSGMSNVAQQYAQWLANHNRLTHEDPTYPQGRTPTDRLACAGINIPAGENLAASPPEQAVQGWMNSPGHRANILTGKYVCCGIGVAWNGSGYVCCQMFSTEYNHYPVYKSAQQAVTIHSDPPNETPEEKKERYAKTANEVQDRLNEFTDAGRNPTFQDLVSWQHIGEPVRAQDPDTTNTESSTLEPEDVRLKRQEQDYRNVLMRLREHASPQLIAYVDQELRRLDLSVGQDHIKGDIIKPVVEPKVRVCCEGCCIANSLNDPMTTCQLCGKDVCCDHLEQHTKWCGKTFYERIQMRIEDLNK